MRKTMNESDSKSRLGSIIFFFAFSLLSLSTMIERSALIDEPDILRTIASIVAIIAFAIKIIFLDKYKIKNLLLSLVIMFVSIIIKLLGGPIFIMSSCFAFMAMKNVDVRKVIKIDLFIKLLFLLSHSLLFFLDYATGLDAVQGFISKSAKGTMISVYFLNPNSAGLIGTWAAIEMLYLNGGRKLKSFVVPSIIAILTFLTTTSRTAFFIYILFLLLQLIKSSRTLMILSKTIYPMFCLVSFLMVVMLARGDSIYNVLNPLLSGRIGNSLTAYSMTGISIMPSSINSELLRDYIIDVFYIKCMVEYGIVTMILYYLPYLAMPTNSKNNDKRIAIITGVYLFFERAVANIGFAPPFLIIADAIYNHKDIQIPVRTQKQADIQ